MIALSPVHYPFKMTNKKTKTPVTPAQSCCLKKQSYFLIIVISITILLLIFLLNLKKDESLPTEEITPPTVEMISDSVEVSDSEESEQLDEIIVSETIEPATVIKDVVAEESTTIMTLDQADTLARPESTNSEKLVKVFLSHYNEKRFKDACDILVDTKCDDRIKASVSRFSDEFQKMKNGYQNISVRQAEVPDFHSDIICVEYDYNYKINANPKPIHEVMSFYVKNNKITYRICEEKTRDGVNIGCPIRARRDFCL
jgi:hypothetical protein